MNPTRLRRTPIRPVQVDLLCGVDGCGGVMTYARSSTAGAMPQYGHRCTECRTEEWVRGHYYPHVAYEEIPDA